MKKQTRSDCPLGTALDIFGDRWSLLILRDVLMANKVRYQDFLESREGIATNLLAQRLDFLVKSGLLVRSKDPHNKKQFFYSPTQKALDLLPVMCEMMHWSLKHHPDARSNYVVDRMLKDEEGFMESIVEKFDDRKRRGKKAAGAEND